MSRNRKRPRPRTVPVSGRSLLVLGEGYIHLPASLADLEQWRQGVGRIADALADEMADAIATGRGSVADADIDGMVIIHWPDGRASVRHARDYARHSRVTEAEIWQALGELADTGLLIPCADGGCRDGGYRAAVSPEEIFGAEFDRIVAPMTGELSWPDGG